MSEKIGLERGMRKLADDELMHWKYIKRERKPDGSYRYYYDVKSTKKGKATYMRNLYDQAAKEARKESKQYRGYEEKYDAQLDFEKAHKWNRRANDLGAKATGYEMESERLTKALSIYNKSSRGKIDDKIAVWSTKIAKVLTSNSSKINKAKNWLKDKLFPTNRYARRR